MKPRVIFETLMGGLFLGSVVALSFVIKKNSENDKLKHDQKQQKEGKSL